MKILCLSRSFTKLYFQFNCLYHEKWVKSGILGSIWLTLGMNQGLRFPGPKLKCSWDPFHYLQLNINVSWYVIVFTGCSFDNTVSVHSRGGNWLPIAPYMHKCWTYWATIAHPYSVCLLSHSKPYELSALQFKNSSWPLKLLNGIFLHFPHYIPVFHCG